MSLLSAAAGLLLIGSLFLFLGELNGDNQRIAGIIVSLLFQAIGVGLLLLSSDQRSANAGVALSAVAVVPLLVYLFVDVRNPDNTIEDAATFTNTATLILLAGAALWLAAYFLGPSRRYGFYLGAALVAFWLVAVVQIVEDPLGNVVEPYTPTLEPGEPGSGGFGSEGFESDGFDDDFGQFEEGPFVEDEGSIFFDDDVSAPEDPSATLGWVSLVFGGGYLAAAGWRDRSGDRRQATVGFAVAVPILTVAVLFLSQPLDAEGAAALAIALGVVGVWLGAGTGRRFTSWYGTAAAVVGVLILVVNALEDSERAMGLALLVIGLVLAAAAARFGDGPSPLRPGGTRSTPWTATRPDNPWATGQGQPPPGPPGRPTPPDGSGQPPPTGQGYFSSPVVSAPTDAPWPTRRRAWPG
jgi:hypothetical protein